MPLQVAAHLLRGPTQLRVKSTEEVAPMQLVVTPTHSFLMRSLNSERTEVPSPTHFLVTRPESQFRNDSLQSCVLGFGFLQDRDVGVGVFPEGEEVLKGSL